MHLREQRRLPALESVDDRELPQRARSVERVDGQHRDEVVELAERPGLRQRDVAEVVLEVEVGIVGPHRGAEVDRARLHPPAQARDARDRLLHPGAKAVEVRSPIEDRDGADVGGQVRVLLEPPHQRFRIAHSPVVIGVRRARFGGGVSHAASLPDRVQNLCNARRATRPRMLPTARPATTSLVWWMRT